MYGMQVCIKTWVAQHVELDSGDSFLQPNGRFETNTKICLSISQHHPEHWQPSWSGAYSLLSVCRKHCLTMSANQGLSHCDSTTLNNKDE